MTILLGIDPGYDRLGWAIAQIESRKLSFVAYDCIVTDRSLDLIERMQNIITKLEALIAKYQPQELAIETLVFARNTTTALKVSEIRGSVITTALTHGLKIAQYNPMTIKLAVTGSGRADKTALSKMMRLLYPNLSQVSHDDTMDALAIALTHALTVHQVQL